MCINVACRADVAVPQPLLNLLQAHAIGIEQTGAAMAQIVKADTLHLVCDQKIREMLAQEIGPNPFSHRVYIDIVKIIFALGPLRVGHEHLAADLYRFIGISATPSAL